MKRTLFTLTSKQRQNTYAIPVGLLAKAQFDSLETLKKVCGKSGGQLRLVANPGLKDGITAIIT